MNCRQLDHALSVVSNNVLCKYRMFPLNRMYVVVISEHGIRMCGLS